jgi:hypothetical protein
VGTLIRNPIHTAVAFHAEAALAEAAQGRSARSGGGTFRVGRPADSDECWKLGVFHFNPQDPSLFVPKRSGLIKGRCLGAAAEASNSATIRFSKIDDGSDSALGRYD